MTNSKTQMINQCQSPNDKIENLTLDIGISIDIRHLEFSFNDPFKPLIFAPQPQVFLQYDHMVHLQDRHTPRFFQNQFYAIMHLVLLLNKGGV